MNKKKQAERAQVALALIAEKIIQDSLINMQALESSANPDDAQLAAKLKPVFATGAGAEGSRLYDEVQVIVGEAAAELYGSMTPLHAIEALKTALSSRTTRLMDVSAKALLSAPSLDEKDIARIVPAKYRKASLSQTFAAHGHNNLAELLTPKAVKIPVYSR